MDGKHCCETSRSAVLLSINIGQYQNWPIVRRTHLFPLDSQGPFSGYSSSSIATLCSRFDNLTHINLGQDQHKRGRVCDNICIPDCPLGGFPSSRVHGILLVSVGCPMATEKSPMICVRWPKRLHAFAFSLKELSWPSMDGAKGRGMKNTKLNTPTEEYFSSYSSPKEYARQSSTPGHFSQDRHILSHVVYAMTSNLPHLKHYYTSLNTSCNQTMLERREALALQRRRKRFSTPPFSTAVPTPIHIYIYLWSTVPTSSNNTALKKTPLWPQHALPRPYIVSIRCGYSYFNGHSQAALKNKRTRKQHVTHIHTSNQTLPDTLHSDSQ